MRVLIVGSGISGLTACYNICKKDPNCEVLLVEKQSRHGGLAKSFVYEDAYTFDVGPKRFHTEDEEVLAFIREIGESCALLQIDRSSKVYFLRKFFDWPLHFKELMRLPLGTGIRSVMDLLSRRSFTPEELQQFRNYIILKYGETLFELFFKPYTEKFLCSPIDEVHSDWASTGINRSIINKEHKGNSLLELVQKVLLPAHVEANFLYPAKGGFGAFWDACAGIALCNPRVTMRTLTTVTALRIVPQGVEATLSDGSSGIWDTVLWSGKLPDLLEVIGVPGEHRPPLGYLDTVFLDLVYESKRVHKKAQCQWLYVSDGTRKISRISFPHLFNPQNIPHGLMGLNVEVTVPEREQGMDAPALLQHVQRELQEIGIVTAGAEACLQHVHREPATYPIYSRRYRHSVADAIGQVRAFSPAVVPMGRSGSFWYNNADHSIKQALKLTNDIIAGRAPDFDCYGWFGGGNT